MATETNDPVTQAAVQEQTKAALNAINSPDVEAAASRVAKYIASVFNPGASESELNGLTLRVLEAYRPVVRIALASAVEAATKGLRTAHVATLAQVALERDEARERVGVLTDAVDKIVRGRSCLYIYCDCPSGWTCLDQQQDARTNPTKYAEKYAADLIAGKHLCDLCIARAALAPSPAAGATEEAGKGDECDHPWHRNPALIMPCPSCGAGGEGTDAPSGKPQAGGEGKQ